MKEGGERGGWKRGLKDGVKRGGWKRDGEGEVVGEGS